MRPDEPISRHNFFMQTNDVLFQQEPFLAELSEPPNVEQIRIRHERQTLRRLPKSRAILFSVRTFLAPLTDLRDEPHSVKELLGAVRNMQVALELLRHQLQN
jgi:dimethylamine monooxygenase subunit A